MICRVWHGWTTAEDADAYERIVREEVIPGIEARKIFGFRHLDLVRRTLADDTTEFATLMWFDDLAAVAAFAGDNHDASYVPPAARAVLARLDALASHYEVIDRRPQFSDRAIAVPLAPLPAATALVIIDVQAGFDAAAWGPRNNPGAEGNIATLLAAWRASGRAVVHVRHASLSPGGHFRPDGPGHAFKPEALPHPEEPIYTKTVNSAFIGTTLEADLRNAAISTLVVVGLTTNHCVSTTVRMGGNLGFATYVVADATATFARPASDGRMRSANDVQAAALGDLAGEFAEVVDTAAIMAALAVAPSVDGKLSASPRSSTEGEQS